MKVRLLIVAGCMNMGGLENQLMNLASNLDTAKYDIAFTSDQLESDYKQDILGKGWEYIFLPSTRDIGILRYCWNLYKLLKKGRYDVIHSHELFHSGLVMLVAFMAGVPKRITHSHSSNDDSAHLNILKRIYHTVMRILIQMFATDRIACSSEAGLFLFGKRNKKKVDIIWNTVETDKYINTGKDNGENGKREFKRIVHVGRFVELKNQRFILRMAAEARKRGNKYVFTFVGDGPTYKKEKEYAEKENLGEIVEFLGRRKDVPDILHNSDLFILPSQFEGMPLSLIEAQTASLPCVVSDTITKEVDFGLNMITRVSLEETVTKWVDIIEEVLLRPRVHNDKILEAIHIKGFDNKDYASKIEKVYLRGL